MAEQTEFAVKTAKALNEVQSRNRRDFMYYLPLIVALTSIIGAGFVGQYRLEAAETAIKEKADEKDVNRDFETIDTKIETVEREFNKELGHVKDDVSEIKDTINDIQREQKQTNDGITAILIKLNIPPPN